MQYENIFLVESSDAGGGRWRSKWGPYTTRGRYAKQVCFSAPFLYPVHIFFSRVLTFSAWGYPLITIELWAERTHAQNTALIDSPLHALPSFKTLLLWKRKTSPGGENRWMKLHYSSVTQTFNDDPTPRSEIILKMKNVYIRSQLWAYVFFELCVIKRQPLLDTFRKNRAPRSKIIYTYWQLLLRKLKRTVYAKPRFCYT